MIDIQEILANKEQRKRFKALIEEVPNIKVRDRKIVLFRCGFEDGETHTLEDTGKFFRLTRERIRQVESKCLEIMRKYYE